MRDYTSRLGYNAGAPVVATPTLAALKSLSRNDLEEFVSEQLLSLAENEALAVLANPYCSPRVCGAIAGNPRLSGFYSIRLRLVAHRQTPQAHSVKLVHYLFWFDLLRLSIDVKVPVAARRAIDTQLLIRLGKLSVGERVAAARQCGPVLIAALLRDPNPKVFESLLANQRLREDDLLTLVHSADATTEQLQLLATDRRWSSRRPVRIALILNPRTPRAAAASQLRHLSRADLRRLHARPEISVYLRRCIERLAVKDER